MKKLGWRGLLVGLMVGLAAGGTAAWAAIPDSTSGRVTTCYPTSGTNQGVLRVIDYQGGAQCGAGEATLTLGSGTCNGIPHESVDWHGCNLRRADLTGAYLGLANLGGADLTGANLAGARLMYANVTNANFTDANLYPVGGATKTNLWGVVGLSSVQLRSIKQVPGSANCPGTVVTGPMLQSVILSGLNLSGFDLHGAVFATGRIASTNLSNANLQRANIDSEYAVGANFSNADLSCALLRSNSFNSVNLSNANLTNATLLGSKGMATATLTGAIWNNTICPDGTNSNNNGNTCVGHL
jgi:uncharacterized protein YjbI with pentapeptide repeats